MEKEKSLDRQALILSEEGDVLSPTDWPQEDCAMILQLMDYSAIITIEPDKRSGKPCIRGTRMTVTDVLEYLAGGMSPEEIVDEFPDLTVNDIRACLAFAADRERKLASLPA